MLAMTSKVSTFATRSKLSAQGVDRCVLLDDCHGVDTDEALDDNIFVSKKFSVSAQFSSSVFKFFSSLYYDYWLPNSVQF